jgi:hypothetical protein
VAVSSLMTAVSDEVGNKRARHSTAGHSKRSIENPNGFHRNSRGRFAVRASSLIDAHSLKRVGVRRDTSDELTVLLKSWSRRSESQIKTIAFGDSFATAKQVRERRVATAEPGALTHTTETQVHGTACWIRTS